MQIWVDQQLQDVDSGSLLTLNNFWSKFTKELFSSGRFIHYVQINDDVFYDGYESIIRENYEHINKIAIYSIQQADALKESLEELSSYISRMIASTDQVASPFYGEPQQEDWDLFQQYCAGLEWMQQTASFCLAIQTIEPEMVPVMKRIEAFVLDTLSALKSQLESEDWTAIADIISYESLTNLEELLTSLKGAEEHA
ncbi:hypothetical protein K0T92_09530 [Paenibacillus oenotherae]|uniref:Poly(3-hydroxyalkanoate) polymerase subunit PhaE n=1 Tax=Paenibacillus oenotherae TaxID=1435645 RepID=A0ABS7D4Z9_9BACL|nr:hypothetical protein [Paenibacillus oenotherae]MBW7474985.1 hypothetical protein [Paenibacillus oenotherae]